MARKPLFTADQFNACIDRLQSIYDTAQPQDVLEGMDWYAAAHREVRKAVLVTRLPEEVLAAAMAVLSIQTEWGKNLAAFWLHVDAYASGAAAPRTQTLFTRSDEVAGQILRTGNAALLGDGPKTGQFQHDVLEHYSPEAATIDSIMTQAGLGVVPSSGLSLGHYRLIEAAVVWLANVHGVLPYQMQAIIWVVWRRHHAKAFKAARRADARARKVAAMQAAALAVEAERAAA